MGRIGPNAIIQVDHALQRWGGAELAERIFGQAQLLHYRLQPPQRMVDEAEVVRLHQLMARELGSEAVAVARDAGTATARYLLANRIPRPMQKALKLLPARAALEVLLRAIARHAWTFVGSGEFSVVRSAQGIELQVQHNPLCRGLQADTPACDYFAACFETLFKTLVHSHARVRETACEACGDDACRFLVTW
jgi:divinyl protochlorophyllide a 8-vinyl-reductase